MLKWTIRRRVGIGAIALGVAVTAGVGWPPLAQAQGDRRTGEIRFSPEAVMAAGYLVVEGAARAPDELHMVHAATDLAQDHAGIDRAALERAVATGVLRIVHMFTYTGKDASIWGNLALICAGPDGLAATHDALATVSGAAALKATEAANFSPLETLLDAAYASAGVDPGRVGSCALDRSHAARYLADWQSHRDAGAWRGTNLLDHWPVLVLNGEVVGPSALNSRLDAIAPAPADTVAGNATAPVIAETEADPQAAASDQPAAGETTAEGTTDGQDGAALDGTPGTRAATAPPPNPATAGGTSAGDTPVDIDTARADAAPVPGPAPPRPADPVETPGAAASGPEDSVAPPAATTSPATSTAETGAPLSAPPDSPADSPADAAPVFPPRPEPKGDLRVPVELRGVYAPTLAACLTYLDRIEDPSRIDAVLPPLSPRDGPALGTILVTSRRAYLFDAANTHCAITQSGSGTNAGWDAAFACTGELAADSVSALHLAAAEPDGSAPKVSATPAGGTPVVMRQCRALGQLGGTFAPLWAPDSTACAISVPLSAGVFTFSVDRDGKLILRVAPADLPGGAGRTMLHAVIDGAPLSQDGGRWDGTGWQISLGAFDMAADRLGWGMFLDVRAAADGYAARLPLFGSSAAMKALAACTAGE